MVYGRWLAIYVTLVAGCLVTEAVGYRRFRQAQQPQLLGGGGAVQTPPPPATPSFTFPSSPVAPSLPTSNRNRPSFVTNVVNTLTSPFAAITSNRVSDASNSFAWDSYKALQVPQQQNVFFSPYSIMNALGMLTLGSSGRTASQLKEVLRFDPVGIGRGITDLFHRGLGLENKKLINDKTSMFAVGNRFFVDSGSASNINPDFLSDLQQYYNSSMQVVNFNSNPSQARQTINDWVSTSTFGKINNFFPSDLDTLTKLILVNTIYFNGQWVLQFNESLTGNGGFQTPSGTVNVPFMQLSGPLQYAKNNQLGVETVVLPYTGFNYAMHIILPTGDNTLESLEARLTAGDIQQLAKSTRQNPVVLKMPKFSLKQRLSLKDMLARLNVVDVFDPFKSDFSNIFVQNRPGLLVDDVIHEALVEVTEKGTIASAATGIVVLRIAQPTKFVTIDKPFLFYISDESNGTILFWGRVSNPSFT